MEACCSLLSEGSGSRCAGATAVGLGSAGEGEADLGSTEAEKATLDSAEAADGRGGMNSEDPC